MTNTTINTNASRAVRAGVVAGLVVIGLVMVGRSPRAATGTLVPALYQTVLDANGNPVSGAKICTYLSGTTTPVVTYTDVNLTVPASNPITADSAGRWATYLTTGLSYKFVLQDATGTAGVCNGAIIRTIDAVAAVPGVANPTVNVDTADLRLTLTAGVPVTTADVTGATTVYVTPYEGNRIALYDGTQWNLRTLTETPITVPTTANAIYDVFAFDTLTVPTYGVVLWNNDFARATALVSQDGVLSLSGFTTRRYVGSFRTGAIAGQTEDSGARRYVWNYAHRADRALQWVSPVAAWTGAGATWRQANATPANQVEILQGVAESAIWLQLIGNGNNDTVAARLNFGIGLDSTTAPIATAVAALQVGTAFQILSATATVSAVPAIGRHVYTWLEATDGAGSALFYGTTPSNLPGSVTTASGLFGRWHS